MLNEAGRVELPPLSEPNLVETLNSKMKGLSINDCRLGRTFARGFSTTDMRSLTRLMLTNNKLDSDCRGSRLLLSHLPTSLKQLDLSRNGLGQLDV